MKEYKKIQPEVIVGLGNKTVFLEQQPPFRTVVSLHIELEDWLGDDLMECTPCLIVSETLKTALQVSGFSGYEFAEMEVTKGEYFDNNYRLKKTLPKFHRMVITGRDKIDDLFIGDDFMLFISDILLDYIKENFSVKYMEIDPGRDEFDDLLDRMIANRKKEIK